MLLTFPAAFCSSGICSPSKRFSECCGSTAPRKVSLKVREIEITGQSREISHHSSCQALGTRGTCRMAGRTMSEEQQHRRGTKRQCRALWGQLQQWLQRCGWCWQLPQGCNAWPQFEPAAAEAFLRDEAKLAGKWVHASGALQQPHRCAGCYDTGWVTHGALWTSALHDAEVCP